MPYQEGAKPGNKDYLKRLISGKLPILSTVDELQERLIEYLYKDSDSTFPDPPSRLFMPTLGGFALFCGYLRGDFIHMENIKQVSPGQDLEEFKRAVKACREIIQELQKGGAGAGAYKDNFVARLQGIGDTVENKINSDGMGVNFTVTERKRGK